MYAIIDLKYMNGKDLKNNDLKMPENLNWTVNREKLAYQNLCNPNITPKWIYFNCIELILSLSVSKWDNYHTHIKQPQIVPHSNTILFTHAISYNFIRFTSKNLHISLPIKIYNTKVSLAHLRVENIRVWWCGCQKI